MIDIELMRRQMQTCGWKGASDTLRVLDDLAETRAQLVETRLSLAACWKVRGKVERELRTLTRELAEFRTRLEATR